MPNTRGPWYTRDPGIPKFRLYSGPGYTRTPGMLGSWVWTPGILGSRGYPHPWYACFPGTPGSRVNLVPGFRVCIPESYVPTHREALDRGAVFFAHEPCVWFSLGERVSFLLCLAPGGHVIDRARGSIFKQRSSNINQFLHRAWQSQSQYHTRMESILTGHHTYKIPHGAAAFVAAGGPLLTGPI